MADEVITSFWKKNSGLLGSDVNSKISYTSKLYSLFRENREEWEEGKGHLQAHRQYDRVGLTADAQADYSAADGWSQPEAIKNNASTNYDGSSSGGAYNTKSNIDPPTDTLKFNGVDRNFGLIQKAFKTQDFSGEDLRAAEASEQQMDAVVDVIMEYARETWIRVYRDELSRVSGNRFIAVANGAFTENGDVNECFDSDQVARWNAYGFGNGTYDTAGTIDTPDKQDTSALTWAHLDELKERILEEDPAGKYATELVDGCPVCYLVTDLKTVRGLMTAASSAGDVRVDIRESSMADELLKGIGVTHAINGWVLVPDIMPRRFDITGDSGDSTGAVGTGVWTERLSYTGSATSRSIASAYRSAACVESYAFLPKAFCSYNPRPSYSGVGEAQFSEFDYTGEYSFEVFKEHDHNSFGHAGRFQGLFATGTLAKEKDVLFTIRHREGNGTNNG
jgi:hypothetical protein